MREKNNFKIISDKIRLKFTISEVSQEEILNSKSPSSLKELPGIASLNFLYPSSIT